MDEYSVTSSVSPLRYSHELLEVPPNSFVHTSLGVRRDPKDGYLLTRAVRLKRGPLVASRRTKCSEDQGTELLCQALAEMTMSHDHSAKR